jgi:hypothetical protein
MNRQTTKTEKVDKHTSEETTKITKENSTGTETMENMQSMTTWKKGSEPKNSEAESFKHMKIKYPKHEDGHVGRNM